jgi:hypothetical protein
VTLPRSPTPTCSTSAAPAPAISPSVTASTTASERPWLVWRGRSRSARCSAGFRTSASRRRRGAALGPR